MMLAANGTGMVKHNVKTVKCVWATGGQTGNKTHFLIIYFEICSSVQYVFNNYILIFIVFMFLPFSVANIFHFTKLISQFFVKLS